MTTLYRFYDADGALLYVGITGVGIVRWYAHAVDKAWWTQVASVKLEHFATRDEALAAESAAILAERPRHNVIGIKPPRPARVGLMRPRGTGSVFWNRRTQRWVATLPCSMGRRIKFFRSKEAAENYLTVILADRAA